MVVGCNQVKVRVTDMDGLPVLDVGVETRTRVAVWDRDELRAGEMWSSSSVLSPGRCPAAAWRPARLSRAAR